MKLLIIRHGDPDYENDTLTERGWREAELLSRKLVKMDIRDFYVSPLGRAKDTIAPTLKILGREAEVKDWLQEFFYAKIERPDRPGRETICWDFLPQDWMIVPEFFDKEKWRDVPCMKNGHVGEIVDSVYAELDQLIASYGYVREGNYYRAVENNNDTIALVCHFGLGALLLSHLLNVSPLIAWQHFCFAPSSVTTVATEERRKGIASFRMISMGSTEHLYVEGVEPSFQARFRECYENDWERID